MPGSGRVFRTDRTTLGLLVGLPLLAGLMLGANQTRAGAFMPWVLSITYWVTISLATWWIIASATWAARVLLRPWEAPPWLASLAGAIAGSFAARPAIYAIADVFRPLMRAPVLRQMPPMRFDTEFLLYYITNWSLIIAMWVAACAISAQLRHRERLRDDASDSEEEQPAVAHGVLLRLPHEFGRDILALEAEDHYVRVHTARGDTLVLGSLSDAIRDVEASGFAGQRTHRSWWVANSAVVANDQRGRVVVLRLTNGIEVPVSTTYRQMAAAKGLLAA